jgi:hypothetical protein
MQHGKARPLAVKYINDHGRRQCDHGELSPLPCRLKPGSEAAPEALAGMAVAMGSGQLDVAWMGPWGYIIANNSTDCAARHADFKHVLRGIDLMCRNECYRIARQH